MPASAVAGIRSSGTPASRSACSSRASRTSTRLVSRYTNHGRLSKSMCGTDVRIAFRSKRSVEVGAVSTTQVIMTDAEVQQVPEVDVPFPHESNAGDNTRLSFVKAAPEVQYGAAVGTGVLLGFSVLSDDLPALRLAILTYALWATGEWVVHKYFMHAKDGSFGDRVTHLNKLHVVHHLDTHKDMTMKDGFERDALYFHFPNSVVQVAFATSVLLAADAVLDLSIPATWTPLAAVLGMATHNVLWNTMHMDMHDVAGDYEDGMPCVSYERSGLFQPYVQWVFDNHTTHHDVGGGSNYNIVCPGPDFLLGTYKHRSRSVALSRSQNGLPQ